MNGQPSSDAEKPSSKPALSVSGIDIEDTNVDHIVKKKEKKRRRNRSNTVHDALKNDITCTKIIKCRGLVFMLLILTISVAHFVIFYIYSSAYAKPFAKINRIGQGLWVFLLLSLMFAFLFLWFLIRWKKLASSWINRHHGQQRSRSTQGLLKRYNDTCGIDGTLYFWRLYFFEFIEISIQIRNLIYIYTCSLPVAISSMFCLILISESLYRAYSMYCTLKGSGTDQISVANRNKQISIDVVLDIIFLVVPLVLIRFFYNLHVQLYEIIWMTLFPSTSLFGKLRRIMMENVFRHADKAIVKRQSEVARKLSRRRKSIFSSERKEIVARRQNKYFPKKAKWLVLIMSIHNAVFLSIVMVIHLSQSKSISQECFEEFEKFGDEFEQLGNSIWNDGCQIKVPFCKDLFVGSCDCASIYIDKHNMTSLPEKITNLTSLKKIYIRNGPLKELPKNMERLTNMGIVDLSFNRLEVFDVDVRKWEHLTLLYIMYNNITHCHRHVWSHDTLIALDVRNNKGLDFPKEINLPSLNYLGFANNSVEIDMEFGGENLPSLYFLFLSENTLILKENFVTLSDNLLMLGIARCQIVYLPLFLKNFEKLHYLDARDNNISFVDIELQQIIVDKRIENYFSGNSVCQRDNKGLNCDELCSQYCWSGKELGNGFCDSSCNSAKCELDGGDCI
jgi:hypothetical protein